MTRPGIEPRSPGPLANTLTPRPMELFCATIRRDSVSLITLPFLSYPEVFSLKISLICSLKYPYSCFPSIFCLLVIFVPLILLWLLLYLMAAINLPPGYLCIRRVVVSMHRRFLQFWWVFPLPLFLTHSVCLRYLRDVRPYASSWVFCSLVYLFKFFPRPFQEGSWVSYKVVIPGVYAFDVISAT